jgi:hypothetical protein
VPAVKSHLPSHAVIYAALPRGMVIFVGDRDGCVTGRRRTASLISTAGRFRGLNVEHT